jgi:filamentous hemagglutinin family protein
MRVRFFLYFLPPLSLIALPSTPQVIVGDVQAPCLQGNEWVIKSGDKAIVHWNEFSIGAEETVRFQQLGNTSAILNRVVGPNSSEILGALLSNGHVYVLNPQGVLIGPNARIEAAGFIASSLDILDQDFLEQKTILFSGEGRGMVVNLGTIQCERGAVALIGQVVKNEGTIRAPEGAIRLGVGSEVLLQLENSPHVIIRTAVTEGALTHTGVIEALEIELKSGSSVYAQAIQCSGIVEATAVGSRNGKIILFAPESECFVDGTLIAHGGTIHVLGEQIHLHDKALLDVSGANGGGEILIGGDFQGTNPDIPNAIRTFVDQDVLLKADALDTGNGGKVIVWSDDQTVHYSKILIRGGPNGGDGGMAEVSGKQLAYLGFTDGGAPLGNRGTLLLDPNDIVVGASATTGSFTGCGTPPSSYTITTGTATNQILNTALVTQLQSCNVTISTVGSAGAGANGGSITVSSAVGSGSTWTAATTLTLQAASFINVTASITNTNVSTAFTAMNFQANAAATYTGTTSGITLGTNGKLITTGGAVTLQGTGGSGSASNTYGIVMTASSSAITVGNGSTITLNGTGGGGGASSGNHGTYLSAGVVTVGSSTGATLIVQGTGGTGSGGNHIGVRATNTLTVSASSTVRFQNIQGDTGLSLTSSIIVGTGSTGSIIFGGAGTPITATGPVAPGVLIQSGTISAATITASNISSGNSSGGYGFQFSGSATMGSTSFPQTISIAASGTSFGILQLVSWQMNTGDGGSITLNGTSSASGSSSGTIGTFLSGGTLNVGSSTGATLTIQGTGGSGSGGVNIGAYIDNIFHISPGSTINFQNIYGGAGPGSDGLELFSSVIVGTGSTGSIIFGGAGTPIQGGANSGYGVYLTNGNTISAGTITASHVTGGAGDGSVNIGFELFLDPIIGNTAFPQTISISATGGGTDTFNCGVHMVGMAVIQTGDGGSITLNGTGGGGTTGNQNHGVFLESGTITVGSSTGATLTIQGTGGGGSGGINHGAEIENTITVNGTSTVNFQNLQGGSGTSSHGLNLASAYAGNGDVTFSNCVGGPSGGNGVNVAAAFTTTGNITAISSITGQGADGVGFSSGFDFSTTGTNKTIAITASATGSTGACHGISLTGGTMSTNSGGSLTLIGTASSSAGSGSYGIYITGSGSKVTNVNGNLALTGQGFGSSAYGIVLEATGNPSVSTTGTGSISFSTTSSSTYLNSANNPVVSSAHNAIFNNAVVLNAATSTIDTSTNNGTLTFSSTINGASSGANSLTLTTGSGDVTLSGNVGGTIPLNALTITGGTLEVSDITTTGVISLQPDSGFTSGPLGNLPDGTIILNGHLTGGAISLAPTGRTAPLSIASITSSLLGNDITIIGSSLTMGSLEALTVLGNLTINVSGAIAVGDVVSLDTIILTGGSLTLYERGPASLLDFLGLLNESLKSHIFARTTVQRNISGAQSINGIIYGFGAPSRSAFETLLIYVPDSLILNLGDVEISSLLLPLPPPLLFVMPLIIANTQMEELLPNSWHRDFFLPWQKKLWIHKKMW